MDKINSALQQDQPRLPMVAVIGSGPAGLRAAFDLAETDHRVLLIERSPATGGLLPLLDHQYPNNHCGLCRMLPMIKRRQGSQYCLKKGFFHSNISVLTSTRLVGLEGRPGQFVLKLEKMTTGVNQQKCKLCLECEKVCPQVVADPGCAGPFERKAIFRPNPLQMPPHLAIDWQACDRCGKCVAACPEQAIDLECGVEKMAIEKIEGLIWAAGPGLYDPAATDLYGCGKLENVMTSLGFERLLGKAGPGGQNLGRPSDGGPITKIAWIQCVGSRNLMIGAEHCSSVCCMFALKEALLAKEILGPDVETTIFYMDMRTFGRDYQAYLDLALERGVRLVRCRVHSLEPADDSGAVQLGFSEPGKPRVEERFDLAVLATGQNPDAGLPEFITTVSEGVVVLDSARYFKDISETVVEASAAAAKMASMIRELGKIVPDTLPTGAEIAFFRDRPKILVALLEVGLKSVEGLDLQALEKEIGALAGNHQAVRLGGFFDQADIDDFTANWEKGEFNRLAVVGGHDCGPFPEMRKMLEGLGILPGMVEFVGLCGTRLEVERDGLAAALEMISMAINRLRRRQPADPAIREICDKALVIGSGPAGLSAARSLADQGVGVILVEREDRLGGNLVHISDQRLRREIEQLAGQVEGMSGISIYRRAKVIESDGRCGEFTSRIMLEDGQKVAVEHGVTIIATGGHKAGTASYGLGKSRRIITQFEFEKILSSPQSEKMVPGQVVMIQCAGSRQKGRNYCSRICCVKALVNAVELKRTWPETEVYIFYRDIMTEGSLETFYNQARKSGVLFLPFDPDKPPRVEVEGEIPVVLGHDPYLDQAVTFRPDLLVLSTGLEPNPISDLAALFQLETTPEGFIREADYKWRPVETLRVGVLVCGLARAPVRADMALKQGQASAQRALEILKSGRIKADRVTARIRPALCSRCRICIPACPYGARFSDPDTGHVLVDAAACQGCGTCAAVCPNKATVVGDFEDGAIMDAIEAAL